LKKSGKKDCENGKNEKKKGEMRDVSENFIMTANGGMRV
jgi:hypothetical protein